MVAEVAGRGDVAGLPGAEAGEGLREVEVFPGMRHVTIERQPAPRSTCAKRCWGRCRRGSSPAAGRLSCSSTPRRRWAELLAIGKVWELAQGPRHKRGAIQYDLVVLDGPASGQLVGLLAAPRTFGAIARVGPVARHGEAIDRMLRSPGSVGVVAVATPEQMAVSETLGLRAALGSELGIELDAIVVNRIRSFVVAAYRRRSASSSADGSGEENSLTAIRARATHRGQCSIASQRACGLMLSPHRAQLRHAEPSRSDLGSFEHARHRRAGPTSRRDPLKAGRGP